MKSTIKFFGIIVAVTIIGLMFVSCSLGVRTVTISGVPRVGQTITATSEGGSTGFTGDFVWETSSTSGAFDWGSTLFIGGSVSGANNQNIELRSGSEGRHIRAFRRTPDGNIIFSNVLGPIQSY